MRSINFSPDEFITGVAGVLTAAEIGAFWVVCSLIYSHGEPIDDDPKRISRIAGCRPAEFCRLRDSLLAKHKLFRGLDGRLSNRRAMVEIRRAEHRMTVALSAAAASADSRRNRRQRDAKRERDVDQSDAKVPPSVDDMLAEPLPLSGNYNGLEPADAHPPSELSRPRPQPRHSLNPKTDSESEGAHALELSNLLPDTCAKGNSHGRATRLPEGWRPSEALVRFAEAEGLDAVRVAANFVDHWRAASGATARKQDWDAAFRVWCRREADHPRAQPLRPAAKRGRSSAFLAGVDLGADILRQKRGW